jgi:hypothetical protein
MTTQRKEPVVPRHVLEAAAAKHGVTTAPSMSDRSIAEAIASKISPGTYSFAGREGDTYAMRACELALEKAAEAAKAAPAPAPEPGVAKAATPGTYTNGSGAPRADAAAPAVLRQDAKPQLVSADAAREKMIRDKRVADMALGIGG